MSPSPLDQAALDQLFLQAHTHNAWLDRDVPDALLEKVRIAISAQLLREIDITD